MAIWPGWSAGTFFASMPHSPSAKAQLTVVPRATTSVIRSIRPWTSVPITDPNDQLGSSSPPYLIGSPHFRDYARIDVGNAIASIEGEVAMQYLLAHNTFDVIDANHNNIITTQEVQNFVDNAANTGHAEEGAMARFLGGTGRICDTLYMISVGSLPENSLLPVSNSYRTTPNAQISARLSTLLPLACSGLI